MSNQVKPANDKAIKGILLATVALVIFLVLVGGNGNDDSRDYRETREQQARERQAREVCRQLGGQMIGDRCENIGGTVWGDELRRRAAELLQD